MRTETSYRMKHLEELTGLKRSTIHFYMREGLLPEADKSAVNAATYDDSHVARLLLLKRLRSNDAGPMPLYLIRKIIELVEQGVDAEVAIALEQAVLNGLPVVEEEGLMDTKACARASGVPEEHIVEFVRCGILIPQPGTVGQFDQLDATMAALLHDIIEKMGWKARDFTPIAHLVQEISDREWQLRNRAIAGKAARDSVPMRADMQRFANFLHTYLFYRARLRNIDSDSSADNNS